MTRDPNEPQPMDIDDPMEVDDPMDVDDPAPKRGTKRKGRDEDDPNDRPTKKPHVHGPPNPPQG